MDKPGLAKELEELRREIEQRLTKTKSRSRFRNSLNSEDVDTDALSECSTNLSIENIETLDHTIDCTPSKLDDCNEKDTCGSDGVHGDIVTPDKETEELPKESEINSEENKHVENNEGDCVEKGMESVNFFIFVL